MKKIFRKMDPIYEQKEIIFKYELSIFMTLLISYICDQLYFYYEPQSFLDISIGSSFYHQIFITACFLMSYFKINKEGFRLVFAPLLLAQFNMCLIKLFKLTGYIASGFQILCLITFLFAYYKLKVFKFPQVTGFYKNIGYKIINFEENQFNKEIAVYYPAKMLKSYKKKDSDDVFWVHSKEFYKVWLESLIRYPSLIQRLVFTCLLSFMSKINLGVIKNAPIIKNLDASIENQINEINNYKKKKNTKNDEKQGKEQDSDDCQNESESEDETFIKPEINPNLQDMEDLKKMKIIILSHGYLAHLNSYTTYCKELASHGYIVFTLQHYEPTLLDGYDKTDDAKEKMDIVKDQRKQHLDWRSIQVHTLIQFLKYKEGMKQLFPNENFECDDQEFILMGHSFGGVTSLHSSLLDSEDSIKAVIAFDPWLFPMEDDKLTEKTDIPILFINSETFDQRSPEYKIMERNKLFLKNQEASYNKYMGFIRNMDHIHPSDVPFLIPQESVILKMINQYENLTKQHFMLMKLSLNFINDFIYPERCVQKDQYIKMIQKRKEKILQINNQKKDVKSVREFEQEVKDNLIYSKFFDFCESELKMISPLETQWS